MLSVELDIFSGMPNPTWILSPQEEKQLLDRIMANPQIMQPPFPKKTIDLGYRGMIIELVKEDDGVWSKARRQSLKNKAAYGAPLPSAFRIHGTTVGLGDNTEKWLAETSEKATSEVEDFLKSFTQEPGPDINTTPADKTAPQDGVDDATDKGSYRGCGANYYTGTNFSFWNGAYKTNNNCYNFAANYRNTYGNGNRATPGRRGGQPFTQFTPSFTRSNLISALLRDGWRNACAGSRNLTIALVVMPRGPTGPDFHFYRKVTGSGIWGHKPGLTPAKATDSSGKVITNPYTCDRRYRVNNRFYPGYTDFYGYFYQDNYTAIVS